MKAILSAAAIAALVITAPASAEFWGDDSNSNFYNDGYGYGYGDGSGRGRGSGEFNMNFTGKADADMETDQSRDFSARSDGRFYNYNTPNGYRPYGWGGNLYYGYGPYGYQPQQAPAVPPAPPAQ